MPRKTRDPDLTPSIPIQAMDPGRYPLRVSAFGMTDQGRVRSSNQDQFVVAEVARALRIRQGSLPQPTTLYGDHNAWLFIVADGMGGHRGGEQASALAVSTIESFLLNALRWFFRLRGEAVLDEFQRALRLADLRVLEEAERRPELRGMGTTLTMAYAVGTTLYVVHVGDSRCYLSRRGRLHQITTDHTLVGEMVRKGLLEPEQALHHSLRHMITNAIGGNEALGLRIEVHKVGLEPGDVVLLCTDGLSQLVPDPELTLVLHHTRDPQTACQRLIDQANELGGTDNVTAIVARFDP